MITVRFYGDLEKYGRKFRLEAQTAGEALRALLYQIPGLKQHLNNGFYRVRIAGNDVSEDTLSQESSLNLQPNSVIHVIPQVAGAKRGGLFSVIAGAVLVVVGVVLISTPFGAPMISAGIGLMLSGVVTMLTKLPEPKFEEGEKHRNTNFSNLDNAMIQGKPIPLCYGEMMIGSKVLSQGLITA